MFSILGTVRQLQKVNMVMFRCLEPAYPMLLMVGPLRYKVSREAYPWAPVAYMYAVAATSWMNTNFKKNEHLLLLLDCTGNFLAKSVPLLLLGLRTLLSGFPK